MMANIMPEELLLYCSSVEEPECELLNELLKDELALSLLGEEGLRKLYERLFESVSSAE